MENYTEYIGYAATIFLMISFLLKDMKKLRMVNTVACLFFIVYGYYINSIPIMLSNAFISCVNLYYLVVSK
ncbi:MAG: YgjV family protein [Chitinophagales bacterium]|nr:YgjV family protein [Bacteroidota bacterium]MCB9226126.1 YgjV family protein [Chitinophagales bacterium]